MPQPLRVLILEDQPSDARLLVSELRQAGYEPQWQRVDTERDYVTHLHDSSPDIILADYNLPQFSAPEALKILRQSGLDIPFIIVSGSIGEEIAVTMMKEGATDFLLKDRLGRLGQAVAQALEQRRLRDTQRQAEETLRERTQLILLTADVGMSLNRGGTLQDMLQPCVESLVPNLDVAQARIWTFDESENVLELQASAGLETRPGELPTRVPLGTRDIGRLANNRTAYATNDLANDAQLDDRRWAIREGLTAFAGYPLTVENRLVGAMAVFARHPLTQALLDGLATVGNQIAAGIQRKRTEERLQFTQFTIDHIAAAVFWSDSTGKFFNVNEAACQLTGYTREELLALPIYALDPSVTPLRWERIWDELQQRCALESVSRLRRKDGTEIPTSVITNLLQAEGRKCSCTIVQDITDRRHLEEQFRQAQKMEAIGQLAGGVAHDFNNLLTIILGYSAILATEEEPPAAERKEMVDEIHRAAERAANLTGQLLAFSRKQILAPRIVNLNDILRDTQKMLRRLIGEDIAIHAKLAPGLELVSADPGQIEQIVMNLVVNARDAMPHGGELCVETANVELDHNYAQSHAEVKPGHYVMLAISDSGHGIDAATRNRIFEPFFTTKAPGKGTGLGLATVYGIVRQSGGHIWVYSEPGQGTTFKIYLPAAAAAAPHDEKSASAPALSGRETILLVEDEDAVRAMARSVLEMYGYTVLEASEPSAAISICKSYTGAIDALLTDVVMPQLNGKRLSELLLPERPQMKVLFMSGYTDDAIVRQGILEAGINFLQKPFTPVALAAKLRSVLNAEVRTNPHHQTASA